MGFQGGKDKAATKSPTAGDSACALPSTVRRKTSHPGILIPAESIRMCTGCKEGLKKSASHAPFLSRLLEAVLRQYQGMIANDGSMGCREQVVVEE